MRFKHMTGKCFICCIIREENNRNIDMFVDLTTWKQGSEWWFLYSLKYRAKLLVEGE